MKGRAHVPWLLPPTCQVELHLSVRHTGIFLEEPISVLTPEVLGRQQQLGGKERILLITPQERIFRITLAIWPGRWILEDVYSGTARRQRQAGITVSTYRKARRRGPKYLYFIHFFVV